MTRRELYAQASRDVAILGALSVTTVATLEAIGIDPSPLEERLKQQTESNIKEAMNG